ncbi:MAG: hypothetical protein BWX88_03739 [Planctomycetes bacterium ADurb.Bin126]|nr:MAG: hypothetical protein BWX88_03739 [Planctomycetes bacterium ADurb.Bin126]HOD81837.1 hypothetical protein [Phycisphaerae bacterium]HQL75648.1 hypothetical protein [Phycisphaerae bacterium]
MKAYNRAACMLLAGLVLTTGRPATGQIILATPFDDVYPQRISDTELKSADPNALTAAQQKFVNERMAKLRQNVELYNRLAEEHPDQAAVWKRLGEQSTGVLARLAQCRFRQDRLDRWWSAWVQGAHPVAAYLLGYVYLDPRFFEVRDPSSAGSAFLEEARIHQRNDQSAAESYLVHEAIHGGAWGDDTGEKAAYVAQYLYLVACGVPANHPALNNALQKLAGYGLIDSVDDTSRLDKALGIDDAVLSVIERHWPTKPAADAPPAPQGPPKPPADPSSQEEAACQRIAASFMEAVRRDVAADTARDGVPRRVEVVVPYVYKKPHLVGSYRVWMRLPGKDEQVGFRHGDRQNPAKVNPYEIAGQYRAKYPDLKWE